jgi:hypothetical protein
VPNEDLHDMCSSQIRDEMGHVALMGQNDMWTFFFYKYVGNEIKQGIEEAG